MVVKVNLAGGKIIHATHQPNPPLVEHLAQNRAAFTDFLHHQPYIRLGNLVNKSMIF